MGYTNPGIHVLFFAKSTDLLMSLFLSRSRITLFETLWCSLIAPFLRNLGHSFNSYMNLHGFREQPYLNAAILITCVLLLVKRSSLLIDLIVIDL